ncbi:DNA alkylation repair protein [Arsenicicoccus sp. oral taxon 190]|uniref:DNA alkylation repair protein n=1 Tax=Arsenicicoccus sp. oral taxon 190 TaxID=1658671 RepID=UPI00209E3B34|nr:DNA alkylation repair protein [Arsenicicoccus sp. oral taxon 190]
MFFQAVPGGYAEGDRFLGVSVPEARQVVRRHRDATLGTVEALLDDPWHEVRLVAALLLVERYRRARSDDERRTAVDLLVRSGPRLDNWDLVDSVAPYVLGAWLVDHPQDRPVLQRLAASAVVWERRLAVVGSFGLIRAGVVTDTLQLCALLADDPHELVHKACGWMMREVGGRDRARLDAFLEEHAHRLPRVTLRTAVEKHDPEQRRRWLAVPSSHSPRPRPR